MSDKPCDGCGGYGYIVSGDREMPCQKCNQQPVARVCQTCGGDEYHEPGWGGYPGPVSDCPDCGGTGEVRDEQPTSD